MNFLSWLITNNKVEDKDKRINPVTGEETKDYSNIGKNNVNYNFDVYGAENGFYPTFVGSQASGGISNTYGGYFAQSAGPGTYPMYGMHSLVRLYRWQAADADIRWAVDEITNEMTIMNKEDNIIELDLDNLEVSDKIKDTIKEEFKTILNMLDFDNTAHFHCSNFYVDGRCFYKIDVDKENIKNGIKAIKLLSPFDVVGYFDQKFSSLSTESTEKLNMNSGYILTETAYDNPQFTGLTRRVPTTTANAYVAVPEELVVYQNSGMIDWRYSVPVSYLQFALKTLNQLRNMKDAMVIYRMTRAPERFVFNVEVGKMQHSKAEQYVSRVADRLKETIQYDPESGAFKDKNDKLAIYKDWYFPKVEGQGTDVDTIQAGQMVGQIEEIEYLQKVLMRQMYIPFSRYFQESSMSFGSDGAEIERSEIKFFKHINKIQIQYNLVFFELLKRQLSFKNIINMKDFDKYKSSIKFVWGTQNLYNETKETALLRRVGSTLSEFENHEGKYISKTWIYKNILHLDDDEIKEMEEQMQEELVKNSYMEQVRNMDVRFNSDGEEMALDSETDQWVNKKDLEDKVEKDIEQDTEKPPGKDANDSTKKDPKAQEDPKSQNVKESVLFEELLKKVNREPIIHNNITMPEYKVPNINVESPIVNVTLPNKKMKKVPVRDANGLITEIKEVDVE